MGSPQGRARGVLSHLSSHFCHACPSDRYDGWKTAQFHGTSSFVPRVSRSAPGKDIGANPKTGSGRTPFQIGGIPRYGVEAVWMQSPAATNLSTCAASPDSVRLSLFTGHVFGGKAAIGTFRK